MSDEHSQGRGSAGAARPGVSIVISSYNYERYVGEAIESALAQDGVPHEVVVVDDGSSDGSRTVIERFGERVLAIFQQNAGQASAVNTGYRASRGEAVIFLDSDDVLLPGAAASVAAALADRSIAKVHWSMPIIDGEGRLTGEIQDEDIAEGDLRRHVFEDGPLSDMTLHSPPTSGNAYPSWLLERVMPVPEDVYRLSPDEYLFGLAPAFGTIARLRPQSLYRVHGANAHQLRSFEQCLAFQEAHHAAVAEVVAGICHEQGIRYDERAWARSAWGPRTGRVVRALAERIPPGERFLLLDEGLLGFERELRGRPVIPFPERDGQFMGIPADDQEALVELERAGGARIGYVAIAWPGFWWLEEYPGLASALRERRCALVDDRDLLLLAIEGR